MPSVDVLSPTYPYERIQDYNSMDGYEEIPKQICDYLMDFPVTTKGYTPPNDNTYPRARLIKYIYYDDAKPLSHNIPTPQQKKSIFYNTSAPANPPSTELGYRIYPVRYVGQAQTAAQTVLRVYTGRVIPTDVYTAQVAIVFDILCGMTLDTNSKESALSRSIAIEKAIIEACNGVNFNGVGTMYYDRRQHGDCGASSITDESANVGRRLIMAMTLKGGSLGQF